MTITQAEDGQSHQGEFDVRPTEALDGLGCGRRWFVQNACPAVIRL